MRKTGETIPDFSFLTLSGKVWESRPTAPPDFRLLVIYRGMWCLKCKMQLQSLNALYDKFDAAGAHAIAVSADTRERTLRTQTNYSLDKLDLGCEMPFGIARELGVFISKGIHEQEMPLFCEPASFLINSDNQIQAAWIASNAFARTSMGDVLSYIDFLRAHPDRGPRGSA